MPALTHREITALSHAKALRKTRELMKLSRQSLATRLSLSAKTIQKYEAGRAILDDMKIASILKALEVTREEYEQVRQGKSKLVRRQSKIGTLTSKKRRSYQKIITKECRVLRSLRRQRNLSQDQASAICGYSRPSIGHIENGRIELTLSRVEHILKSYGYTFKDYENCLNRELQKDEIADLCIMKVRLLSEEKLSLLSGILDSFAGVGHE